MNAIVLTLLLLASQAVAPKDAARQPQRAALDEYVVGPQDVLTLTIFNDETLSRPALTVDNDGTIDVPYVNRVKVGGLTTRQIEEELQRLLGVRTDEQGRVRGYLKNPNINVTVKEFRSQRVYVTGAVRIPGFVELQGDPTLTRALAEAGYPTTESGSYVQISHPGDGQSLTSGAPPVSGSENPIRVPRTDIDNGRASNIRLRAGDHIFVPTADRFFIIGEVKSTGQYVLNGELNVLQALALAGGVTDRANKGSIKIERVVNGKKIEIKAKESTMVQAGDTIKGTEAVLVTMDEAPRRVLHLCAGNMYGGVERIVAECAIERTLCPEMTPSFAVCFEGRLAQELDEAGASCTRLGAVRVSRPHTILRARRRLGQLLERDQPASVICHSSWMFGLAAPVVRAAGAALILWVHDRLSGRTWAERWARLTPPDLIVANSRFTAASVASVYPGLIPEVIYAPVPAATPVWHRAEVRAGLGVDERTPVILMASRFEAWKGHRELIAAAARTSEPWVTWLAGWPQRSGEEAYEQALRDFAAAAGVSDRVRFLGERRDVPALMRAADVHCQPNTAPEPFGLVFVEALHAGLPVVTTAIGGALEIVTASCGVLVPPGDEEALARALHTLLVDRDARARLGSAGPARARELCDPARQLAALAARMDRVDARHS